MNSSDRNAGPTAAQSGSMDGIAGYVMKRAYIVVHAAAQSALSELDLRILSFSVLSMVADNPGITASELAALLQMERSNLVGLIDELEDRGLLSRRRQTSDRRRYALTATEKGVALSKKAFLAVDRAEKAILDVLDDEEQATLMRLLRKVDGG